MQAVAYGGMVLALAVLLDVGREFPVRQQAAELVSTLASSESRIGAILTSSLAVTVKGPSHRVVTAVDTNHISGTLAPSDRAGTMHVSMTN